MQAILILGIFGLVYGTIVAVTILLSSSGMQINLQRIEQTRQIFLDAEFAMNKGVLGVFADVAEFAATGEVGSGLTDITYASQYTRWSIDDLQKDPWGHDYRVAHFSEPGGVRLYADGDGNTVIAPVEAFAFISVGTDGQLDTTMPTTYAEILALDEDPDNDDVIHTFTTYSAALTQWNDALSVVDKIASLAVQDYKSKYENFLPIIQKYYEDEIDLYYDGSGNFAATNANLDNWRNAYNATLDPGLLGCTDALCPSRLPTGMSFSMSPFPIIADEFTDIGAENEIERVPPVLNTINMNYINEDIVDFSMVPRSGIGWTVTYTTRVDGNVVITGF